MAQNFQKQVVQIAHGFSDGDAIAFNGTYFKAQGDSVSDAENFVGFVTIVTNADSFVFDFGGLTSVAYGGLVSGDRYYLDAATAGRITNTPPGGPGDVIKPVLLADSASTGFILYSSIDSTGAFLEIANNLSDVADVQTSVYNLFPNGQAFDSLTSLSLDFNGRAFFDSASNLSITYENRQLFDSASALVMDYENLFLNDSSQILAQSWDIRQWYDAAGVKSGDWDLRGMFAPDGTTQTVDWSGGQLNDLSALLSVNWQNRQLFSSDGTTVAIDYSDINQIIFSTFQGTEFAIVPGAAPVVNYFTVNGAPTANTPILYSIGSDTDVGMTFQTQGAGNIDFTTDGNGGILLLAQPGGAIANAFRMFVANTGNSPVFSVNGSDPNVSMELQAQGTGVVFSNNPISAFAGLRVSEAANGKQGIATLVAGTVTVANTSVTANSRIWYCGQDSNVTGWLNLTKNVGVGFTITSSVNLDTGIVAYLINEPA